MRGKNYIIGICKEVQQAFASLRYGKRNMGNNLVRVLGVSGSFVFEIGYFGVVVFFSHGD